MKTASKVHILGYFFSCWSWGAGLLSASPHPGETQWANGSSRTTRAQPSISFHLLEEQLHLPHLCCRGHPGGHCAADLKLGRRTPTLGAPAEARTSSLCSGSFRDREGSLGSARGFGKPEPRSGAPLENSWLPLVAISRGKGSELNSSLKVESKMTGRKKRERVWEEQRFSEVADAVDFESQKDIWCIL